MLSAQPLHKYEKCMGGVDQLDFLNNFRPCIGGQKWYWTQLIASTIANGRLLPLQ